MIEQKMDNIPLRRAANTTGAEPPPVISMLYLCYAMFRYVDLVVNWIKLFQSVRFSWFFYYNFRLDSRHSQKIL